MGNFGRRLGNTFGVVTRLPGTVFSGAMDLVSAPLYGCLNFYDRMGKRSYDIKHAIHNAINTGPNWKRWIRRPLALTSGLVSYITGGIRAGLASTRDTVGYILQSLGNTFNNAGSAIKRMGEAHPIKEFSFAKLQPEITTMNSVLPRRFPAIAARTTAAPAPAAAAA